MVILSVPVKIIVATIMESTLLLGPCIYGALMYTPHEYHKLHDIAHEVEHERQVAQRKLKEQMNRVIKHRASILASSIDTAVLPHMASDVAVSPAPQDQNRSSSVATAAEHTLVSNPVARPHVQAAAAASSHSH
jgi:hypothetical protein